MERREESMGTRDIASASETAGRDDETGRETVEREDATAPDTVGRDEATTPDTLGRDEATTPDTLGRDDASAPDTLGRDHASAPDTAGRDHASAPDTAGRDDETPSQLRAQESEARGGGTATADDSESPPLLAANESADFGRRWDDLQTTFVDEPRRAVEEADMLVASVMQRLADGFARERERLEGQWSRGEDVSTEDLRVTLQRYRSFFRRLLSA